MPPLSAFFKYRVFLSHSSKDNDLVDRIYKAIVSLGMFCYVDNRDIRAGDYLPQMLKDEIDDCHVLVAVYSKDGFASHWVHEEVGMAYYADKNIIALCMPEVDLGDLQTQIGKRVIVIHPNAESEAIERLKSNLWRLRLKNRLTIAGWALGAYLLWRRIKSQKKN